MARELWLERDNDPVQSYWFPLDDIGEVKIMTVAVEDRVRWVVLGLRRGQFDHRDGRAAWIELWQGDPFPWDQDERTGDWGSPERTAARVHAVEAARRIVVNLGNQVLRPGGLLDGIPKGGS